MQDFEKTKEQLITELNELRREIATVKAGHTPSRDVVKMKVSEDVFRNLADQALKESHERLELALKGADLGWYDLDLTTGVGVIDQRMFDMIECNPGDFERTLAVWEQFVHPEDRKAAVEHIREHLQGLRDGVDHEYRIRKKSGGYTWVMARGRVVERDKDNRPLRMAGTVMDITLQKTVQEKLRESEERYRTILTTAMDGFWLVDKTGRILEVNDAYCDMVGYGREELIGKNITDVELIESQEQVARHLTKIQKEGTDRFETVQRRKDGSTVQVEVSVRLLPREEGKLFTFLRDISYRKKAEETQKLLFAAIEQAAEGVIISDPVGTIQYVNQAEETLAGYTRDELIGQTIHIFKSDAHDEAFFKNMWETINAGNVWSGRFVNKKKDGTQYHEDASISPVYDNSGNLTNFVAVKHDVTEQFKLQQQLLQAQKMEAVGTLAGGVAHDFNNILQIVLGYSELLLIGKNPEHPDYRNLHTINATANRGADLVQRLMVFSRKGDTKPRPLNLNHQVTQVKKLLERTIPKMIAIDLSLEGDLAVINADPVQVEQILINLAINAKDAMPQEGGKLTIQSRNVALDKVYCRAHLGAKPGQYVLLSVSDTGHGMSPETVQHIFEPFFTTKGVGKGTGLGLAIVYGIVKQHEGYINCDSQPGHGTTFQIYFPVAETELEEDLEQEGAALIGGSETILLVDDEEFLCDMGSQLLTRAGYTVLTATNGSDAINIYRNQRNVISLVILDLIMPEMGGKECFQALVNIDPEVKVIISSGLLSDGTTEEAIALGFRGYVEKPHNMRQLLQTVREVLDRD